MEFAIFLIVGAILSSTCDTYQLPGQNINCDANEEYFGGYCFEFVNATKPISYLNASAACLGRGKSLAKVTSAAMQSFLANSAEMKAWSRAMIGLRLSRDKWTWAKDGSLLYGQGCYIDNTERRDLNLSTQFLYNLKTADCVDFCRTQPTARFAGVQGGRQCFCGAEYGSMPATTNCLTQCGGDSSSVCGGLGANYIYAIDGAYSNWEDGRPSNEGGCAAMVLGKRNLFAWRDFQCSTRMAHICQFDEYRDVSDVSAYFCLFTTCYVLYDLQKPWYAARSHCQMLGGDLLKIDTIKVHSELVAMLSDHLYLGQVWIGASSGKWSWSDGAALGYSCWSTYSNQPIVDSPINTCAELNSAESNYNWIARDCNAVTGRSTFLCQRDSASATATSSIESDGGYKTGGSSLAVISDPQSQSGSGSSAYGVVWYGWLLIGLMIGLVVCVIVFALLYAFCWRKSARSSKLGSASASRSASVTHLKSAKNRREGVGSSGLGSSVNSTTSSKPSSSSDRHRMIDDTQNNPGAGTTHRPCGHEPRAGHHSHSHSIGSGAGVQEVAATPGSAGSGGSNKQQQPRSSSATKSTEHQSGERLSGTPAPAITTNSTTNQHTDSRPTSEEAHGGRRRSRGSNASRVGPTPPQPSSTHTSIDKMSTPRDPFTVDHNDKV